MKSVFTFHTPEIQFDCKFRTKSIFSFAQKYDDILDVKDLFACRIILMENQTQICYEILNLIQEKWQVLPNTFKDYILNPKKKRISIVASRYLDMRIMFFRNPNKNK